MLDKLCTDLVRHLVKFLDPVGVEALVKTHPSLRSTVLLYINEHRPVPLVAMINMNAYVFNILSRPVPGFPPRIEILRLIQDLLGPFRAIAQIPRVVLAGGSLSHILRNGTLPGPESDLDFFIYGAKDQRSVTLTAIMAVLSPLSPRLHVRANVVDVFIPGQRRIQIVSGRSDYSHPLEVIHAFDFGHVQVFYDGRGLFATHLAVNALTSGVNVPARRVLTSDRVEKALARGFRLWDGQPATISDPSEVTLRGRFLVDSIHSAVSASPAEVDMDPFVRGLPRCLDVAQFLSSGGYTRGGVYGGGEKSVIKRDRLNMEDVEAIRTPGSRSIHPNVVTPAVNGEVVLVRTRPFRCTFVNDGAWRNLSHPSVVTDDEEVRNLCDSVLGRLLDLESLRTEHTKVTGGPEDRTARRVRLTLAKDGIVTDAYDCPQEALPKPGQYVVCDIAFSLHHGNRPGRVWTPRTRMPACFSKRVQRITIL